MDLLGALGAPRDSAGSSWRSLRAVPKAKHGFMRIWRGAWASKLSVCTVNNVSNTNAWNTKPALGILGAQRGTATGSDADPAARNPPYTRAGGKDDVSS